MEASHELSEQIALKREQHREAVKPRGWYANLYRWKTLNQKSQSIGSARLGSARLGSARLGSARLGSARLGSARLGSARLGSARLGSARLGSARLGSARLGSARLGSARLGSARLGSARLGSARLGSAKSIRSPGFKCQDLDHNIDHNIFAVSHRRKHRSHFARHVLASLPEPVEPPRRGRISPNPNAAHSRASPTGMQGGMVRSHPCDIVGARRATTGRSTITTGESARTSHVLGTGQTPRRLCRAGSPRRLPRDRRCTPSPHGRPDGR